MASKLDKTITLKLSILLVTDKLNRLDLPSIGEVIADVEHSGLKLRGAVAATQETGVRAAVARQSQREASARVPGWNRRRSDAAAVWPGRSEAARQRRRAGGGR